VTLHQSRTVLIAVFVRVFRALTALMPRDYRAAQAREAVALMGRLLTEAHVRRGRRGVLGVAIPAIADLMWRIALDLDRWSLVFDSIQRDIRDGIRTISRRPVHSVAIVSTLALGIGLNAAVFSVVDWVLLRPLPYPAPQELVRVWVGATDPAAPAMVTYSQVDRLSAVPAIRSATGFSVATRVASSDRFEPMHVMVARVTGDLFGVLRVSPLVGRAFDTSEVRSGQPVVVLSEALWRNRLAADPDIAGRLITIDKVAHTIVGVMPAGRGYPRDADLWRPVTNAEREDDDRENVAIARLAGPLSPAVMAQLSAAMVSNGEPGAGPAMMRAERLQESEARNLRAALLLISAAALAVLLIACANVASLLGTRVVERAGEMAVRGALGARRGQLARQLVVESALLALAGGILGLLLGSWTLDLVVAMAPPGMPRIEEIALDGRVIMLSSVLLFLIGGAVGIAPAHSASRVDLRTTLDNGSLRVSGAAGGRRLLVASQVVLAVVLTVVSGLLARSLQHVVSIDHGFRPDGVVAVNLNLRGTDPDASAALFRNLVDVATAVPSVQSAAVAFRLPTEIGGLRMSTQIQGQPSMPAVLRLVTPGYFETVDMRLLEGRSLSLADTRQSPRVAVINRAYARALLHGVAPVDQTLTTDLVSGRIAIVGVVSDVTPAGEADSPALYVSFEQFSINAGSLLVRITGDPAAVIPSLVSGLRAAAPGLPLDRIQTLNDALAAGRAAARFSALLASSFGLLAIALALIGIYGLSAIEVASRRREAGVRLALGATRGELLWDVMAPTARALLIAMTLGLVAAAAAAIAMRSLLEGVQPLDPIAFVVLPSLLGVVGVLAALMAGWPLLRVDPSAALRL
jgi:putative ABC transport system permease protein